MFSSEGDAVPLCRHTFPAAQLRNTFIFSGLAKSMKVIVYNKNNLFTPNLIGLYVNMQHACAVDLIIMVCESEVDFFLQIVHL